MQPIIQFDGGQIVFIAIACIAALALGIAVIVAVKTVFFRREFAPQDRVQLLKRWKTVEELLRRPDESSYKLAVLEADKLLDHALQSAHFGGENFRERITAASAQYPALRNAWPAHRIRNQLVHEPSYRLNRGQASRAVSQFKDALRKLGAL